MITRHERGKCETVQVRSDHNLVVPWIAHYRTRLVLPLGEQYETAGVIALAPAPLAVWTANEADGDYPHHAFWRKERDDVTEAATQ